MEYSFREMADECDITTNDDESNFTEDEVSRLSHDQHDLSSVDDMETDDEQSVIEFDGVESLCRILCRCRKIISIINKSTILNDFMEKWSPANFNGGLITDMKVRWGSTYKMIVSLLELWLIVTQIIDDSSSLPGVTKAQAKALVDNSLDDSEWSTLKIIGDVLEVFHNATEMLSGKTYPALSLAYSVLDSLHFFLNSASDNPLEKAIKLLLKQAFDKYIIRSADSPIYRYVLVRETRQMMSFYMSSVVYPCLRQTVTPTTIHICRVEGIDLFLSD